MKPHLMYRNRDFDPEQSLRHYPLYGDRDIDARQLLSPQDRALIQDLELDTLLHAMAGDDKFLLEVTERALLSGLQNDEATIRYRQEILKDCLKNPEAVKRIYELMAEAIEETRKRWLDLASRFTSSKLYSALDALGISVGMLRKLRGIVEGLEGRFESEGFRTLFAMLRRDLNEEYLAAIEDHLKGLRFRQGVALSAELGEWNESANLALRKVIDKRRNWLERILGKCSSGYTFHLAERDEAGARILSDMRNRGISRVVVALAQSANHVVSFFKILRAELGFYCGCLNLYNRLARKGEPLCFPTPAPPGSRRLYFSGLYDVCLSLRLEHRAVGNAIRADGKSVVIVTGANQGGKSTFLRSIGLAQMMMQSGMFVGAEDFTADLCPSLFTHYKREEDASMMSGKLDEELARMSDIADHIEPDSLLLLNESFAATNEREGSEIARQIVRALAERCIRILFVTHLYDFAHGLFENGFSEAMFLRPERKADGERTFKIIEGEPLETSYGEDLYRQVFDAQGVTQAGESRDRVLNSAAAEPARRAG